MSVWGVLESTLILGGVGLAFGMLIAIAHRKFKVWEDPRLDGVTALLPGTNCGACGFPGCRAFAEGLVAAETEPVGCTVMGTDEITDVAEYLGVEAGEAQRRIARLLCAGGSNVAIQQADYLGWDTCRAAAAVAGGGKGCNWGCIGLADCRDVCDLDAIYMNAFNIPVVIPERCTACNDCVEVCPKDLFTLMPVDHKLLVQCKNLLEGDEAEEQCTVACTACGMCVVDARPGVIELVHGLAVIDYEKNDLTGPEAIKRCPTSAIVWLEGAQFQEGAQFERIGAA